MASPEEKKVADAAPKEEDEEKQEGGFAEFGSDFLANLLRQTHLGREEAPKVEQVLEEVTVDGIVKHIQSGKAKNILIMAGAGISTSAGIPDFRSPGSGLYDNLAKYNLPSPQAIFELGYFKENPEPFFQLAKELWPGVFKPTPSHYFIRLLHEKSLLLRHYTQNIDTLERVAGVPENELVEAHGTFHTSHCLKCRHQYSQEWMKDQVFSKSVPRCEKDDCQGLVKPDIVFFGEALPERFFACTSKDLSSCDLLIIMGTSLVVQPFASLASRVPDTCPRLYINLEAAPGGDSLMTMLGYGHGFRFNEPDNYRDVFYQGTCDDGCSNLADKLGWGDELRDLLNREHERIDAATDGNQSPAAEAEALSGPEAKTKDIKKDETDSKDEAKKDSDLKSEL